MSRTPFPWDTTGQRAEVDVCVGYPLAFEALWQDATRVSLDGIYVRLASPAHPVRMKRLAGRPMDIEDIRALGFDPEVGDGDEARGGLGHLERCGALAGGGV